MNKPNKVDCQRWLTVSIQNALDEMLRILNVIISYFFSGSYSPSLPLS